MYNEGYFPQGRIFDYGIAHQAPAIERGQTSRILVYPGAFNPPHNGHSALLHQALTKSGRDANIIAAIILPIDDERLKSKLGEQQGTLLLTKRQRATLWNGNYGPSSWIFDYSESLWQTFQEQLIKITASDGFDLEFVCLCGPDYVTVRRNPEERRWYCQNFVVSDVGRSADFTFSATTKLSQLRGYQPWKKVRPDIEALKRRAEEGASWICSGLSLLGSETAQSMLQSKNLAVLISCGELMMPQVPTASNSSSNNSTMNMSKNTKQSEYAVA